MDKEENNKFVTIYPLNKFIIDESTLKMTIINYKSKLGKVGDTFCFHW